jgi:hypothetical protein
MQVQRWQLFALLASVIWLVGGGLLASSKEAWIAAWRLYCSIAAEPTCVDTVFLAVHWRAIAGVLLCPLVLTWFVAWGVVALRRRTWRR